jgi:hypothetical protein
MGKIQMTKPMTPQTHLNFEKHAQNGQIFLLRIQWYAQKRFPLHGSQETEAESFVVQCHHCKLL